MAFEVLRRLERRLAVAVGHVQADQRAASEVRAVREVALGDRHAVERAPRRLDVAHLEIDAAEEPVGVGTGLRDVDPVRLEHREVAQERFLGLGQLAPHELQAAVPERHRQAREQRAVAVGLGHGLLPQREGLRAVGHDQGEHRAHPEEAVVRLEQRAALHGAQGQLGRGVRVARFDHPAERHGPLEHLRAGPVAEWLVAQPPRFLEGALHVGAEVDRDQLHGLQGVAFVVQLWRKLGECPLGERRRGLGAAREDQRA